MYNKEWHLYNLDSGFMNLSPSKRIKILTSFSIFKLLGAYFIYDEDDDLKSEIDRYIFSRFSTSEIEVVEEIAPRNDHFKPQFMRYVIWIQDISNAITYYCPDPWHLCVIDIFIETFGRICKKLIVLHELSREKSNVCQLIKKHCFIKDKKLNKHHNFLSMRRLRKHKRESYIKRKLFNDILMFKKKEGDTNPILIY